MTRLRFYDTTLRDGLRNSGVSVALHDRVRFVRQLERAGVDAIEVGFGGPQQVEIMRTLAGAAKTATVFGLSRPHRRDRERVMRSLASAHSPGINIFSPVSDRFLGYLGWDRAEACRRIDRAIKHARAEMSHVMFSTQDASGADVDVDFACELIATALAAGADTVSVSDTTSRALPHEFAALCRRLRERTPGAEDACWSVHCHNALGLAVANVLAAVATGVRQIECTVSGLGEGAGNTPFEPVVRALSTRAEAFDEAHVAIDPQSLDTLRSLLARITVADEATDSDVSALLERWRRAASETDATDDP